MKTIKPIIRKNINFLSVTPSGTKSLLPKGGDPFCPGNFRVVTFILKVGKWAKFKD
jgi:hypothetical protein